MKSYFISLLKNKALYLVIALILVVFAISQSTHLSFSQFTLKNPDQSQNQVAFPYVGIGQAGVYTLSGQISRGEYSATQIRIIPDDELLALRINQQDVDISGIPIEARRDYRNGFSIDLTQFLNKGKNSVEFVFSNNGGPMGIVARASENDVFNRNLSFLLLGLFSALFYILIKQTSLRPSFKILLASGFALRLFYFMVTPPDVRGHDLEDHYDYILHMSKHWFPPSVEAAVGGAYFHPPLYYYTGAIVHSLTQIFNPGNHFASYRALQLLSLAYSMGFLFFGLLTLQLLFSQYRTLTPSAGSILSLAYWKNQWQGDAITWISGTLLTFWPVAIIHSTRIGNDPLLYFTFAAGLYFIFKWNSSESKKDFLLAGIFAGLSIISKANGSILVATLGSLVLFKAVSQKEFLKYLKQSIKPLIPILIGLSIAFAPGLILTFEGKRDHLYIDNISGLSQANIVGNTAANYFWFDAKIFITEPFTSPFDDKMGRQFFWNYLGKTGLFGEFDYSHALCRNTASIISFLAIALFLYSLIGLYQMRREDFKRLLPLLFAFGFLWGGITYMRMTFPANVDFRYITPILISMVAFFGVSVLNYERQGKWNAVLLGMSLAFAFAILSILFIIGLY